MSRSAPTPQDDCDGRRDRQRRPEEFSLDKAGEAAGVVHTVVITETDAAGRRPAGASPQQTSRRCLDPGGRMADYTATAICEGGTG